MNEELLSGEDSDVTRNILPEPTGSLARCRKWFQAAVDGGRRWRDEAREDYEFVAGKQWSDEEIANFEDDGRHKIKKKLTRVIHCAKVTAEDIHIARRGASQSLF